jgi:hypothetical protein
LIRNSSCFESGTSTKSCPCVSCHHSLKKKVEYKIYFFPAKNYKEKKKGGGGWNQKIKKIKNKIKKLKIVTLPPPHHIPAKAFLCVIPLDSLNPIQFINAGGERKRLKKCAYLHSKQWKQLRLR